eukprot:TRINITY_DN8765_c0_g1_i1.p1 TRINITY_DN8765_c0_g1~~TRINITY_DN8765_c0_g1_i1.p1  ORF type:complete len:339 (-),score=41.87 TRINITY_DN8765_c0_g1_i1:2-1018(-)
MAEAAHDLHLWDVGKKFQEKRDIKIDRLKKKKEAESQAENTHVPKVSNMAQTIRRGDLTEHFKTWHERVERKKEKLRQQSEVKDPPKKISSRPPEAIVQHLMDYDQRIKRNLQKKAEEVVKQQGLRPVPQIDPKSRELASQLSQSTVDRLYTVPTKTLTTEECKGPRLTKEQVQDFLQRAYSQQEYRQRKLEQKKQSLIKELEGECTFAPKTGRPPTRAFAGDVTERLATLTPTTTVHHAREAAEVLSRTNTPQRTRSPARRRSQSTPSRVPYSARQLDSYVAAHTIRSGRELSPQPGQLASPCPTEKSVSAQSPSVSDIVQYFGDLVRELDVTLEAL